jgi:hypothetical protein
VQLLVVFGGYALARYADRKRPSMTGVKMAGGVLSIAGVAFLALAFA